MRNITRKIVNETLPKEEKELGCTKDFNDKFEISGGIHLKRE
jgi:hypothetical protein